MNVSLFVVILAAVVQGTYSIDKPLKRSVQCDSILATKVCDRFRVVATKLKLKANAIEEQIKDAYAKGFSKADEIKTEVEKYLQEKILSKKCEDLFNQAFCDKLDAIYLQLKDKKVQLQNKIKETIVKLYPVAVNLKSAVEDAIKNHLLTLTCADVLPADKCQQIKDIGTALKLNAQQIKNATMESLMKGYKKVQDTVMTTLTKMKKYAEDFTCEELLNPNVCINLRSYAKKIRIGMPKMMNAVRSAIVMGYKFGKGFLTVVYKIADAFIDCEQFLSHDNCESIKSLAHKVGVTATNVKEMIIKAVKKGVTEATKIYTTVLDYLKNKFGRKRRSILEKRDLQETLEKYKTMLKNGIAKAEEYLKKAIAKTLDALKVADAKIRDAVEKAILAGKTKHADIKKLIEDLLKVGGDKHISKRGVTSSLRDLLIKALGTSTGIVHATIKNLLSMTNTQLHSITRYVQTIIDSVLGEHKRDTEDEELDNTADLMVKESLKRITDEFSDSVDQMMADIAEGTAVVMNDAVKHQMHKRLIDIDLSKLQLKDVVESILKNHFGKIYEKLAAKSSELTKTIKEALESAGNRMIDVSKMVLAKVNEMIEKMKLSDF